MSPSTDILRAADGNGADRTPPPSLNETVKALERRDVGGPYRAAVILGSGLGDFAGRLENATAISYGELPGFPRTSVAGHAGELFSGTVEGQRVLAFGGRFHRYEGHSFARTVLPVALAAALGCQKLIISNAAGAINTSYRVGDLMVVGDILRPNHLVHPTSARPFRYNLYPFAEKAYGMARDLELPVHLGTYLYVTGPNYETKAEIRAFREMGGDAVGMSTAPELAEAARLGLPAVAVSLISNMASGVVSGARLNHEEVKEAAGARREDFARLVTQLIRDL
ncbi:MAG: purine-nucleoside phosphorylase [Balneolaceae bacterium]|nr:purine-nucleoside phosphorylase [Balneolaceae bacterium]